MISPTGSVINVILLSSSQQRGITFTPMVLNKSYEIFGLSLALESIATGAVWSCHILFIGNNSEIVAVTRPVRSAIVTKKCTLSPHSPR